ncbi:MAG TPA: AAA family ATPase, partial [Pilimelia sp.]|nr:AAA family ATPase [Pilimelia sp.]
STFVGRSDDLARVDKLLGESRLVTLTGPGGAGKTRLAVEAAGRLDGDVAFVELAPLAPGADVAHAVVSGLGLRESALLSVDRRGEPVDRLVAALADRPLLLVLDNCEHVVAPTAALVDRLLRACPRLRVLATSREGLGITGETLCPVLPLALPPPGVAPAEAAEYPAVRLFVDRAAAVRPDFVLDGPTADAVGRVCRALDGLPLAIELAAARLRSLTPAELAARLDDRFALLSRGSRAAVARHRTLRAVVEWSWDLLADEERTLARRLTVFRGGATLPAVEAVCGLPRPAALDALAGLVEKSLVDALPSGRYRMLETVRAFAAERLAEAGEAAGLGAAHAAYFLELARRAEPCLRRGDQLAWLGRLDAERDNITAAVRRCAAAGRAAEALRLVALLSGFWWLRGLRGEGAAVAAEALRAQAGPPPPELAEEYALCLLNAVLDGSPGPVADPVGVAGAVLSGLPGPTRYPFLNVLYAMAAGPPPADVLTLLQRKQVTGDPWMQALSWYGNGAISLYAGRWGAAEADFVAALAGFRAVGERWGLTMTLTELAQLAYWRGDWAAGGAFADEALETATELGSAADQATVISKRAEGRAGAGDLAGAEDDYRRATGLARSAGAPEALAEAEYGLGELARRRGDLAAAQQWYAQAQAHCPAGWFSAEQYRSFILVGQARVELARGDVPAARDRLRQAYRRPAAAHSPEYSGYAVAAAVAEALADVAL